MMHLNGPFTIFNLCEISRASGMLDPTLELAFSKQKKRNSPQDQGIYAMLSTRNMALNGFKWHLVPLF
jgi:hypothetical protein